MINIPNTPALVHDSPILRSGFLSMMVIGKSGCGKTNFVVSLIPHLSPDIKSVIIATVIHDAPAHESIVKYCRKHGKTAGLCYEPGELRTALAMARENRLVTMSKQGLIIFDDFNTGSTRGEYWNATIDSFTKGRNNGWNFVIISQYPSFIPPIVRNNTTCRVLFDCYTDYAGSAFRRDIAARLASPEAYDLLVRYIRNVPYTYIIVQDKPFTIGTGKMDQMRTVMTEKSVLIPTLKEIMAELHVDSLEEVRKKTSMLQAKAGNNAPQLLENS